MYTTVYCVYCVRRLRCPYGKLVVLQELATDLSLHRLAALCAQQLPWTARQAWATANNTSTTATGSATTAVATDSSSGVVVVPKSALESDLSGLVGCAQHADLHIVLHGEHCYDHYCYYCQNLSDCNCTACCNVSTAEATCIHAATTVVRHIAVSQDQLSLSDSTVVHTCAMLHYGSL
jgi:hypothetical protein